MPEHQQLDDLIKRLEPVARVGGFLKWLICAVAVGTAWLTTLQLEVNAQREGIAEIRIDRKARIEQADKWRSQKDKEDATRDAMLSNVIELVRHQQAQLDGDRRQ